MFTEMMVGMGYGDTVRAIRITANQTNFNLRTAHDALYGAPAAAVQVACSIDTGVVISGGSAGVAFTTGSWPAGSTLTLVNNGSILGGGGAGGVRGGGTRIGASGRAAISLGADMSIDNTAIGQIFGGGGGGGSGGYKDSGAAISSAGGGGGGGGRGTGNADGGTDNQAPSGGGHGVDGDDGSQSSAGPGGAGYDNSFYGNKGGKGGAGGGYGTKGQDGNDGTPSGQSGAAGGAAGPSVSLNGHAVTWLGGNNTTQVKGPVA